MLKKKLIPQNNGSFKYNKKKPTKYNNFNKKIMGEYAIDEPHNPYNLNNLNAGPRLVSKPINIPQVLYSNKKKINNGSISLGGKKFIHISGFGRRKIRYQKNGRPYVIFKKKKIKI